MRGIDQLYSLEMDDAAKTFDSVSQIAPTDPRGHFFRSMVDFWLFTLKREEKDYEAFLDRSEKVIDICEDILDRDENNGYAKFYLGGIHGYRGMAYQTNGSFLKAVNEGRKGYAYLEEAVAKNPDLYDAQMGFGLFRYLVAKTPRSFEWVARLLGFSGDLEGGLNSLKLAAEKGVYAKGEATMFLAQFLFNEHRRDEAFTYLNALIRKYPENTLFLTLYASWQSRQGNTDEALVAVKKVAELNSKKKIRYGEEFAYSTLGSIYFSKNEFVAARDNLALFVQKVKSKEYVSNWIYYRLGVSNEILGDRAAAMEAYRMMRKANDRERAYDVRPYRLGQDRLERPMREPDILLVKASNDIGRKSYDTALALYGEALARAESDVDIQAQALYGMQQVQSEKENYPEVLAVSQRLLALAPPRERWLIPNGYFRLGQAYAKLGKVEEAQRSFEMVEKYDDYDGQSGLEERVEEELKKLKSAR
jgi:tetratricopeptide (TPR) repeat protein